MDRDKLIELLEQCYRAGENRGFQREKAIYDFCDWKDDHYEDITEVCGWEKFDNSISNCAIHGVRLALITFEESKHKFLSEKYRHEYAVKVVDEYLGDL